MFEQAKERNQEQSSCMVGLHGVVGLGKTTLCKCMVNFYNKLYYGRSCLVEFPSDGDKSEIVKQCQRALRKLTNLDKNFLSSEADTLDAVIQLMEEHMSGHDVFLAIDNVMKSSLEEAEKLLRVRFSGNSKVLLTSRSEQLLQALLFAEHSNSSYISPLPSLEHEEAYQIFEKSVKLGDLNLLVDEKQIDSFLARCRFNGIYHAQALKALAQRVYSECALIDPGKLKDQLSVILHAISNSELESVEKVIADSYERLPELQKHVFLDIAHLLIMENKGIVSTKDAAYEPRLWLCRLYKDQGLEKREINRLIYELALDGFIQLGVVDAFGEKMIGVHDLYLDLAQKEAANDPRFLMKTPPTKPVEKKIQYKMLERVLLLGPHENKNLLDRECPVLRFLGKLQKRECPKLQVLVVAGGHIKSPIHLDSMPSLRVLLLHGNKFSHGILEDNRVEFRSEEKRTLIRNVLSSGVLKPNSPCQVQVLLVQSCTLTQIEGLESLSSLKRLEVRKCDALWRMECNLSRLNCLEEVIIKQCTGLKSEMVIGLKDIFDQLKRLDLDGRLSTELKCVMDSEGNGTG